MVKTKQSDDGLSFVVSKEWLDAFKQLILPGENFGTACTRILLSNLPRIRKLKVLEKRWEAGCIHRRMYFPSKIRKEIEELSLKLGFSKAGLIRHILLYPSTDKPQPITEPEEVAHILEMFEPQVDTFVPIEAIINKTKNRCSLSELKTHLHILAKYDSLKLIYRPNSKSYGFKDNNTYSHVYLYDDAPYVSREEIIRIVIKSHLNKKQSNPESDMKINQLLLNIARRPVPIKSNLTTIAYLANIVQNPVSAFIADMPLRNLLNALSSEQVKEANIVLKTGRITVLRLVSPQSLPPQKWRSNLLKKMSDPIILIA